MDTEVAADHAGANGEAEGLSANYKPWLEESTLSSQSAADSTGRGEEWEKSISTITEWYENSPV